MCSRISNSIWFAIGKGFEHLKDLRPIPGRLEFCGFSKTEAKIYVDYAHTPDALTAALFSLRELTENKITLVFGCGGVEIDLRDLSWEK